MQWMIIALGVVSVGIAIYLYFFFKRALATFGLSTQDGWVRLLLAIASLSIAFLCFNIKSLGFLVLLHVLVFSWIFLLVDFFLKTFAKNKYRSSFTVWKKIYGSGVLPLFLAGVVMLVGYVNLNTVKKTDYTVYTDKAIREEGYRIALLADIHYGVSLNETELLEKCEEISRQKPDIVVLCGDIVDDETPKEDLNELFSALGGIENRFGIYYVFGNHDRPMSHMQGEYSEEDLVSAIEASGIVILQDDILTVNDEILLIGREDRSAGRRDQGRVELKDLLRDVDGEKFILTLDHQPNDFDENARLGTDLLLSGHTHGGQLFPLNLLQEIIPFNDGVYGTYALDEDSVAIVTSGFAGWAYPVKTSAPAEYVMIDIQKQKG